MNEREKRRMKNKEEGKNVRKEEKKIDKVGKRTNTDYKIRW